MKIGIALKTTYTGDREPEFINGSIEWDGYVDDVRSFFAYITNEQNTLTFIQILESGVLYCYVRRKSGRDNDNRAYFLYVPASADISPKKLVEIVNCFVDCSARRDKDGLRSLTEVEYGERKSLVYTSSNRDAAKMAVFDKNKRDLGEFLSLVGYQQFNSEYKGVIIADGQEESINTEDISGKQLERPITIKPPTQEEMERKWNVGGVTLYVNDKPFTAPMKVLSGSKLDVEARRQYCNPVKFTVLPIIDGQSISINGAQQFACEISSRNFRVLDENGNPIKGADISVNSWRLGNGPISVNAAVEARLSVRADGYETQERPFMPLEITVETIYLVRTVQEYKGTIELRGGARADIILKGTNLPDATIAPELYGYKMRRTSSGVVYTPDDAAGRDNTRKQNSGHMSSLLMIVLSLILIGGGVGLTLLYQHIFPATGEDTSEQQITSALDYLNREVLFVRTEMEQIPELRGLFDAMVEYNSAAICKPELRTLRDSSERLSRIIRAIQRTPYPISTNPARNGDTIKADRYVDFLNERHYRGNSPRTSAEPVVEPALPAGVAPDPKIQYLNEKDVWKESDMTSIGLGTIYTKLNTYRIKDFLTELNAIVPENKRSEKLKTLVRALQPYKDENLVDKKFSGDGSVRPYRTPGGYLSRLSEAMNGSPSTQIDATDATQNQDENLLGDSIR